MTPALVEQARAAARKFVGGGEHLPVPPPLPLEVRADFADGARLGDVGIALAVIAALIATGYLLRSAAPQARPLVFAAVALGVLMLTAVNPHFWQLSSVTVTETDVSIARHSASDLRMTWGDLREIQVHEGEPFPYIQDDTSLRLVDSSGSALDIPRYLPNSAGLAAAIVSAIESRSAP